MTTIHHTIFAGASPFRARRRVRHHDTSCAGWRARSIFDLRAVASDAAHYPEGVA
jgi:hypothetical protein